MKKTSAAFVKFFVPKKSDGNDCDKSEKSDTEPCRAFMSFQIKDDMKMAPKVRRDFTNLDKTAMDKLISSESDASQLYMNKLKSKAIIPGKSSRTWVDDEYDEKTMNSDDLFVIGTNSIDYDWARMKSQLLLRNAIGIKINRF